MMKFNFKSFISLAFLLSLFSACSPRISENVYKKYTPTDPGEVSIFNPSDTIPTSAEVIGALTVMENNFSNLRLRDVKTILRETTAKNGGNGFAIYDIAPAKKEKSACPYMSGMMLYMKDTIILKDSVHSLTQEIIQFQEKKKAKRLPHNNFTMDIGYGSITSKVIVPFDLTNGSLKDGVYFELGYKYIWDSGWFAGLSYGQYQSSANNYSTELNMRQSYITPNFGFKFKLGSKFIIASTFGVGFYNYGEKIKDEQLKYKGDISGVTTRLDFDGEYLLHKNISLGAKIGVINGIFQAEENVNSEEKSSSGIKTFFLSVGPRFYF